jgi:ABC-2 type transport system permease protein
MLENPSSPLAYKPWLLTHLENIYYLTIKELRSIRADYVMPVLVAYTFTIAVYTGATGASTNPQDLTVGVVDVDHSNLSRQFLDALNRPPLFKRAVLIDANEIDPIMNAGQMIFILETMLSGGVTSMEGEPLWLQYMMRMSDPHFVDFSQARPVSRRRSFHRLAAACCNDGNRQRVLHGFT